MTETPDNLDVAVNQVAKTKPVRRNSTGAEPGEGTEQIAVRAPREQHLRWKQAAAMCGISMSEYIRRVVNDRTDELLDCKHPAVSQRTVFGKGIYCGACQQLIRPLPSVAGRNVRLG